MGKMQQESLESPTTPITPEDLSWTHGVRFDSESISLEGRYTDELSVFRARKNWVEAFENSFLLDSGHDYVIKARSNLSEGKFTLRCDFLSACGRYAFWRLINHQAPDVQYLIETAHLPNCESAHPDFISAPDLTSVRDNSPLVAPRRRTYSRRRAGWFGWLKRAFGLSAKAKRS